jgi:hypothetical protein
VSGYGLDDQAIEVRSLAGGERIFLLASVSRPALGPTQPPVQWVPGVLSPGLKRDRGMTLTTHPHLVPRSRMSRSYTSSSPSTSVTCSGTAFYFISLVSILMALYWLAYIFISLDCLVYLLFVLLGASSLGEAELGQAAQNKL